MKTAPGVIIVLVAWTSASSAMAEDDPREVEGRASFARGDYDAALEVFSRLFAEKSDPVFLRNIGRCYQMLRRPDRAIGAFREYLRRDRNLTAEERGEVEGFIREMEQLKAELARTQGPGPAVPSPATPPPIAAEGRPPSALAAPPAGAVSVVSPAGNEAPPANGPALTRRWWFWAAVGTAVVAGTVTAVALGSHKGLGRPPCPMGAACPLN